MKRNRGRNRRSGGGQNPNRHYESTGPDVKIRGSAQQIFEKYQQYARDAQSAGDRVAAENYLQHAEHYYRIVAAMQPKDRPQDNQSSNDDDDNDNDVDDDNDAEADASSDDSDGGESDKSQNSGRENRDNRDGQGGGRNRNRRNRRDRRDEKDGESEGRNPLEVVDADEGGSNEPQSIGKSSDSGDGESKPSGTRRRNYRKRDAEGDAGNDDNAGVMAIVSRGGRRRAEAEDADEESVAE